MLTLRLPDGSTKQVPEGTRPRDVAESIGKRLAQAAVAAKVNGTVVDLDRELPAGNGELSFQILTDKDREALDVLRHSCAMALRAAGVDISVIALWLGHESIESTQIYLHADLAVKEEALARTAPLGTTPGRYKPTDSLLAFLESL